MSFVRSLARPLAGPLATAITGASGAGDLAAQVRALFSASGGDFTGTMLNFGKTENLWQDTGATTPAGDGDPLGRVDDDSGEGNNATQAASDARPALTTDPFGTLVASTDGTDDSMDLPDGVLGDGTQHVHIFAAYGYEAGPSESFARLVAANTGSASGGNSISAFHNADDTVRLVVGDGATAGVAAFSYGRPLTSDETVVRADFAVPGGTNIIRLNGVQVASNAHGYASFDDPGAGSIFGAGTAENLACTCHGIVILTGSRAMTATEIATVEAYLADLASDTLLTAAPDVVLQREFTPATDLNVVDGFSASDWTDNSAGTSSITLNAGTDITFNVVGADAAIADRTFRTRVGFRYTITSTSSAGVTISADEATAGGTTYGTGASISFIATTSTVYVRASTTTNADTLTALSIDEVAPTGTYYDMLDDAKLYKDFAGTEAQIGDRVALALPSRTADVLGGDIWPASPSTVQSDWTDNGGGSYTYDGTNDADGLLDNGGTTGVLYRVTFTVSGLTSGNLVVVGAGGGITFSVSGNGAVEGFVRSNSASIGITGNTANAGTTVSGISFEPVTGYPLIQTATDSRPLLTANGLDFDGVDDYLEAVDPDADLAIVGDLTTLGVVNFDTMTGTEFYLSSGDPGSSVRNIAYSAFRSSNPEFGFRQADGSASEEKGNSVSAPVAGADTLISYVRDGADLIAAQDVALVETGTFTIVTTPAAGSAPITVLGTEIRGTDPFAGTIPLIHIANTANATGLLLHKERAAQEKTA